MTAGLEYLEPATLDRSRLDRDAWRRGGRAQFQSVPLMSSAGCFEFNTSDVAAELVSVDSVPELGRKAEEQRVGHIEVKGVDVSESRAEY